MGRGPITRECDGKAGCQKKPVSKEGQAGTTVTTKVKYGGHAKISSELKLI